MSLNFSLFSFYRYKNLDNTSYLYFLPSRKETFNHSELSKLLFLDRASKSLDQLKYVFHEKDPAIGESAATLDQLFPNSGQEVTEDNAWQELQYSHAGLKFSI